MSGPSRPSLSSMERKVRYRELLTNLTTLEDDQSNYVARMRMTADAVEEAQDLMQQCNISEQAKYSGEYYLDSRVLRATSGLAVGCSQAITSNVNIYDKNELAHHIKGNPTFWECMFPREVPPVGFMFGAHTQPPPPRTHAARRPRARAQPLAALTAPKRVDRLEQTEEGTEMVTKMRKFIIRTFKENGKKPLSYFHLVVDPHNFTATIENVYRLSFLVRDGDVSMHIDEESGLPMLKPVSSSQKEITQQQDANQFIVSLDMKLWKELIEALNITRAML